MQMRMRLVRRLLWLGVFWGFSRVCVFGEGFLRDEVSLVHIFLFL